MCVYTLCIYSRNILHMSYGIYLYIFTNIFYLYINIYSFLNIYIWKYIYFIYI